MLLLTLLFALAALLTPTIYHHHPKEQHTTIMSDADYRLPTNVKVSPRRGDLKEEGRGVSSARERFSR